MRFPTRFLAVVAVLLIAGCRSSEPQTMSIADAKALQSGGEPVKFEALQGFLPGTDAIASAGWEKKDMTGMALRQPVKGEQASRTRKKGDIEVVVDILDTVFNQSLYAPVAAYLSNGFNSSDANGYKKAVSVGGQPAFEEWNKKAHTGGLTVLVGKRFLVHVRGTGLDSMDSVTFVAGQIDLTRLAALK